MEHMGARNDAAEEALALVRSGAFLRGGVVDLDAALAGTGLAYERVDDAATALEYLGGQTYRGDQRILEQSWLDVRENAIADRHGETDKLGRVAEAKALRTSLGRALEPLLSRLPAPYVRQLDDYTIDLVEYAIARRLGIESLFTRIFPVYRAGALPCGWRGRYPVGALLVHVPSAR